MSISKASQHQDAAGAAGSPLGVFLDGVLIELVPNTDPHGNEARSRAADRLGRPVEILIVCPSHPAVAAVDCLVCVPED